MARAVGAVTVKYVNGIAAVFASEADALAQAAHDRSFPGHVPPALIVDGDHGESHAEWEDGKPKNRKLILHDARSVGRLECGCLECEYQRHAPAMGSGADRGELLDALKRARMLPVESDQASRWLREHGIPRIAGRGVPGAGFSVTFTAVALSAATAKTVMGVLSGANTPIDIVEFSVDGDAASGNLLAELVFGTNASNAPGTNSTSFTPLSIRGPGQAMNGTAGVTWTAEPTVLTVVKRWRMPWPGGPFVIQAPLGRETNSITAASTSGKFVGVRLTSSGAVTNSDGYLEIEE